MWPFTSPIRPSAQDVLGHRPGPSRQSHFSARGCALNGKRPFDAVPRFSRLTGASLSSRSTVSGVPVVLNLTSTRGLGSPTSWQWNRMNCVPFETLGTAGAWELSTRVLGLLRWFLTGRVLFVHPAGVTPG